MITRLLERALLSAACCVCGLRALGAGLDLCASCREGLPAPPQAAPAQSLGSIPGSFDRVLIPHAYRYPIDEFIRALKFRGERRYGRVLGLLLAAAHVRSAATAPSSLVPLPLHLARLRRRGFNQASTIATYAGAALGVRVEGSRLLRVRTTAEQSRLGPGQRQLNVLGAFAARGRFQSEARIAIVDDVVTTGSTAREAALCLREAGAQHVELWAAAQVPWGRAAQP